MITSRPNTQIEESFRIREEQRKNKLKKLEATVYQRPAIPQITAKASKLKPSADLITRLYKQPLEKQLERLGSARGGLHNNHPQRMCHSSLTNDNYGFGRTNSRSKTPQSLSNKLDDPLNYNNLQARSARDLDNPKKRLEIDTMHKSSDDLKYVSTLHSAKNKDSTVNVQTYCPVLDDSSIHIQPQSASSCSTIRKIVPNFESKKSNFQSTHSFKQKSTKNPKTVDKHNYSSTPQATTSAKWTNNSTAQLSSRARSKESLHSNRDKHDMVIHSEKESNLEQSVNLDMYQRNEMWLQKRNERIDLQRQQNSAKQIEDCTFQPKLYKRQANNQSETPLYEIIAQPVKLGFSNFYSPQNQTSNAVKEVRQPSPPSTSEAKRRKQDEELMEQLKAYLPPRNVNIKIHIDENRNHFNVYNTNQSATPRKSIYTDPEKQRKLINYILDSERGSIKA